jgi:hypothetical protein
MRTGGAACFRLSVSSARASGGARPPRGFDARAAIVQLRTYLAEERIALLKSFGVSRQGNGRGHPRDDLLENDTDPRCCRRSNAYTRSARAWHAHC